MAANLQPIFPLTPVVTWGTVNSGNTAKDGTGTTATVFTAGTNGARVDSIKIRALGTNVATVVRFFINNGGANSTPSNNILFHEVTAAATTLSETSSLTDTFLNFNGIGLPQLVLPPGFRLMATIGTTVAAGLAISVVGGNY